MLAACVTPTTKPAQLFPKLVPASLGPWWPLADRPSGKWRTALSGSGPVVATLEARGTRLVLLERAARHGGASRNSSRNTKLGDVAVQDVRPTRFTHG